MKTKLITKFSKMTTEKLMGKPRKSYRSGKMQRQIAQELERRLPDDDLKEINKYSNMSTVKLLKKSTKVYESEEKMGAIGEEIIRRFPDEKELNKALKVLGIKI